MANHLILITFACCSVDWNIMNNPQHTRVHPPSNARSHTTNPPRGARTSTLVDTNPVFPHKKPGADVDPGKYSTPPRRKRRCQSCLPTPRRSNTSQNTPASSRDNIARLNRPAGGSHPTHGSIRAKDLIISNPIPIPGGGTVPRGRRPGNLVPIVPFKEINRDFSSPDSSDLSSARSRTASEARTPMSELSLMSDTDITSVGGSSGDGEDGEEEGQSTLSYGGATTTTTATTTSTGYDSGYTSSSASVGGYTTTSTTTAAGVSRISGSKMTANMHIHRLSMNMDSRLNELNPNINPNPNPAVEAGGKHHPRPRPAPLTLDTTTTAPLDPRRAVRTSTQSHTSDIPPLHLAHPGNRQSAVVQFSDPAYAHHVASLSRSMSTAEKRRSIRLIPRELYEEPPPAPVGSMGSSEGGVSQATSMNSRPTTGGVGGSGSRPTTGTGPGTGGHAHHNHMSVYTPNPPGAGAGAGFPPPAPSPPLSVSSYTTSRDPSPPRARTHTHTLTSLGGTPTPAPPPPPSMTTTPTSTTGDRTTGGLKEKKSFGQVARTVLLLPPLVTVLVVDKAWRKVRGKKGPRAMGDVPGVWKVLGMAGS